MPWVNSPSGHATGRIRGTFLGARQRPAIGAFVHQTLFRRTGSRTCAVTCLYACVTLGCALPAHAARPAAPVPAPGATATVAPATTTAIPTGPGILAAGPRTGRILDAAGRVVAGAEVDVPALKRRATTDGGGWFDLRLPPGRHRILVRRTGFEPLDRELQVITGVAIELRLTPRHIQTPPVVVRAERNPKRTTDGQPGRYGLDTDRMAKQIANFEDVVRGVQALPGVSAASDLQGEFFVRGSNAAANSIWLDGVEIFFPYHLLGFNSIFNPGLIESAEFWSGGAPAEFGDATGGTLAIRSRGLLPAREHGAAGVSYLSAQARAAGSNTHAGYALSVRRSYHDKLLQLLHQPAGREIPAFHDLFARAHWQLSRRNVVAIGALRAGDDIQLAQPELRASDFDFIAADAASRERAFRDYAARDRLQIANRLTHATAYWRLLLGDSAYIETTAGFVPQSFQFSLRGDNRESVAIHSQTSSLRQDLAWRTARHRTGLGWLVYRDDTVRHVSAWVGILGLRDSNASLNLHDLKERYDFDRARRRDFSAGYAQHEWTIASHATLGGGVRYEHDGLTAQTLWSPRTSLELRTGPRLALRGTWGIVHGLRDKPMEVLPTVDGRAVGAERSIETTVGMVGTLSRAWTTGVSAYQKRSSQLVYQSAPAVYANGGIGEAHGVELWTRYEPHNRPLQFGFNCTWSKARELDPLAWRRRPNYRAENIDDFWKAVYETPYWYRPMQDEPLRFGVDAGWRMRSWDVGLRLQVASGRPYTPVRSVATDPLNTKYGISGDLGSARYPLYRRLDARISRHFDTTNFHWSLYADVLNVTAAENVFQIRYNPAYTSRYVIRMLPTLPTLGLEARF